jgi:hypothetical protein
MNEKNEILPMKISISAFEHPSLFTHLTAIHNTKLRSREVKRLAEFALNAKHSTTSVMSQPIKPDIQPQATSKHNPLSNSKIIDPFDFNLQDLGLEYV